MSKQIDFNYINHIFQLDWYDQERLDFYNRYTDFQNDMYKPNRSVVYSEFGYDWNTSGVCVNSKILFSERKGNLSVVIHIAQTRNGYGGGLDITEGGFLSCSFLPSWKNCKHQSQWAAVADLISHTDNRRARTIIRNFSSDLRQLQLF